MKKSVLAVLLLVSLFLCGNSYARTDCGERCCQEEYPRLTVTGKGKIEIAADKAYFNVRVRAEEKKLDKAFELGTERINSIQDVLKSFSIKKEDIRNIGYVYHPLYEGKKFFSTIDRPSSYEVLYSLRVTLYDMDKLGKILAQLSEISETTVFGVQYTAKNITELKREVLKKAGQDARQKALKLAEGAGAQLGETLSIQSYAQQEPDTISNSYIEDESSGYLAESPRRRMPAPQLQSGYIEINGSCSVVYSLR